MTVVTEPEIRSTGPLRFAVVHELLRRPAGFASLMVIAAIVMTAILAPLIATHDPQQIDTARILNGPSWEHLLGTDYIGRDVFSRVIFGSRIALQIALSGVLLAFVPGLVIGLTAGYFGGAFDKGAIVAIDTLLAVPGIILALVVLTLFGPSVRNIILLIAFALMPGYARLARGQTLAIKQNVYIKAERSLGASRTRIIVRHILPNILPPLLVLIAIDIPGAIGIEAGLAFLGVGIQAPTPDWGVMLNNGFVYFRTSIWSLVAPLVVLVLVTAAFTILGETLRDIYDPKLAGATGRRRPWQRSRGIPKP